MSANLILMGEAPNVIGAMQAGNALGQQVNDGRYQTQYRNALTQYGAGALQGDQNAMNALAAFDPAAMQSLQTGTLNMDATRLNMQSVQAQMAERREAARREAQAAAAQMSADQAAAAAAQVQSVLQGAMAAQDEQTYNGWLQQNGLNPAQYPFAQRDLHAATLMGYSEVLEMRAKEAELNATPPIGYIATGEQAAALGLDPNGAYNVTVDGTEMSATAIGGGGVNTTVNNNAAPAVDPFAARLAETEADIFAGMMEAGPPAARNIARLRQLEEMLTSTPTGLAAGVQRLAGEFGIPTEGLSEIQAVQALINSMVPEQRQPGSGPMSDADLALFKQSVPRIINQPGGNALIVRTMRAINEYDLQLATIAQQAAAGEITRAEARRMVNGLQNPLEGFASGPVDGAGAPNAPRLMFDPATGEIR